MKNARVLDVVALIVLIIGGLNWGLIGFFEWNFVASVFGYTTVMTRTIYAIIGISAIYKIITWSKKDRK